MTIGQISDETQQRCTLLSCIALLLGAFGIADFASAQQEPPKIPPEIQERLDRLTAPPPTHYRIEVGEHVFRVPVEYVTQYPPSRDFFSMMIYWPGMIPYKQGVPEGLEDRFQVFVREGVVEEIEQVARDWQRILENDGEKLDEYPTVPSLQTANPQSAITGFYFAEKADSLLNQEILMIICGPPRALHEVGTCSTQFSPIPGVAVMMRFDKKTLPQWKDVLSQISQLLKNFKEDGNDL